jgi:alpha-tubulin suppressor-like RCC1 family protein
MPVNYNTPQCLSTFFEYTALEGGHWHTVGIRKDSTVWSWGHNFYGELGNGNREHFQNQVITNEKTALKNIVKIVSVGYHTLALNSSGYVYSWGSNDFGELGHFGKAIQPFAKKINGLSNIVSVAVG